MAMNSSTSCLHPVQRMAVSSTPSNLPNVCVRHPGGIHSLGDSLEVFVRREDPERFIEEVRGGDPEVAKRLRIEEREVDSGGPN